MHTMISYHIHIRAKFDISDLYSPNCYLLYFRGEMNRQTILFSPTVNPEKLLKYEKKVPEFFLLGAVVDNRILSKKEER